ncbi:MAG: glycosyltransferase family 4 protein [Edaphocola sp.]
MIYVVLAIVLFASMLAYFRIADKYNIIDKPNQRSSHTQITIRGGGIVFPITALLAGFAFKASTNDWMLIAGVLAISIVSFWDDVSSLPNKLRVVVHLLAVTALLYSLNAFVLLPWWVVAISYVLTIGAINAYNFMDGINGITGVYSLVLLLSAWLFYYQNIFDSGLKMSVQIKPLIIACLVFLFFNFRKKAKCFAGDVGSVSIGYLAIAIVAGIIIQTGELKYVFFFAVYGVDAVLTIVHRLLLRQNIFEAHRLHFYQILANERKMPHLAVSTLYGIAQLTINVFIVNTEFNWVLTGLLVCVPLALLYVTVKPKLMNIALYK